MPSLQRIGKDKVINHHHEVPFRVLEKQYSFGDEGSENMIIHGDNLEGLKSLLPQYEGKIKCIYIDPPYNTGNEGRVYNDNMNHPKIKKWLGGVVGKEGEDFNRHDKRLCMMYPRLKLLHKLLKNDGIIFISIDDTELHNLKLILEEIFGPNNFISTITWHRKRGKDNSAKFFSKVHEYLLVFAKDITKAEIKKTEIEDSTLKAYKNPDNDPKGPYRLLGTRARGGQGGSKYAFTNKEGKIFSERLRLMNLESMCRCDQEGRLVIKGDKIYRKLYLSENSGAIPETIRTDTSNAANAADEIKSIMGSLIFDTPKPLPYIEKIFKLSTSSGDIILDSFAGSGTTAHAVLNLNKKDGANRKFILLELMDYADTTTAERAKRVIKGYGEGSKAIDGTGGGFSYYTLGQTLFDEEDNLNETIDLETIKQYIRYTETKTTYVSQQESYFLGRYKTTDYYFYYEHDRATVLDLDFISSLSPSSDYRLIYADVCHLSSSFLTKHKIIFKKIPRDITRF